LGTVRTLIRDLDPAITIQESRARSSQLGIQLFPAQVATINECSRMGKVCRFPCKSFGA
jgi:hypothetical protein